MITMATFITLAGFYVLYLSSEKIEIAENALRTVALKNRKITGLIGSVGILLGFLAFCFELGLGAGIFSGFIALMTIGSMVITLAPLRKISTAMVFILFLFSLIVEELNTLI